MKVDAYQIRIHYIVAKYATAMPISAASLQMSEDMRAGARMVWLVSDVA